jgi:hypothetical protein
VCRYRGRAAFANVQAGRGGIAAGSVHLGALVRCLANCLDAALDMD